jgi:hypothetical protein
MNASVVKELSAALPAPRSAPRSQPAPEWLRDLMAARAHYEESLGWPMAVQITQRRLAVALGTVVDAITMPAALGTRVQAQLGIALLAGPVIGHTEGGRWTFLTQTVPPDRDDFAAGLAAHDVQHAGAGAYTVVPVHGVDAGWHWVAAPRPNQSPPSAYAVAATVRRVCAAVRVS